MIDLPVIRQQFPLIESNEHCSHYLDNAATVQKPQSVIERISQFYQTENAAVHRGIHTLSSKATNAVELSRSAMAAFVNANCQQEVIFTKGTTESLNLIAQSWGRNELSADDEIIITEMEHHANIVPWQLLAAERGIKLVIWRLKSDGTLCLDELNTLITSRTRVISVTHVSNVLGTINPVKQICTIAKQHNITSIVDGAQAVMHAKVDVQAIGCDFYVFSGHKMYGPTGIGVLWGKKALLDAMPPWQGGGAMIEDVDLFSGSTWADVPARFEAGTPNVEGILAIASAIEFIQGVGIDAIAEHEESLIQYAYQRLSDIDNLEIYGPAERAGVISFNLKGIHAYDVGSFLDKYSVAIRTGHHCAMPIMKFYQVDSMCRASIAVYNNKQDIDALYNGLLRVQKLLSSELA